MDADARQQRVVDSAAYLVDHIAEVPAMVIAIRLDRLPAGAHNAEVAGYHGSVAPGVWSFQLAARARGLGSAWTTFHLYHEQQVAELLGIPDTVTQVALLPGRLLHGRHLLAGAASTGARDHLLQPLEADDLTDLRSPRRPASVRGCGSRVPSPSQPARFEPQQTATPSTLMPQVYSSPGGQLVERRARR